MRLVSVAFLVACSGGATRPAIEPSEHPCTSCSPTCPCEPAPAANDLVIEAHLAAEESHHATDRADEVLVRLRELHPMEAAEVRALTDSGEVLAAPPE